MRHLGIIIGIFKKAVSELHIISPCNLRIPSYQGGAHAHIVRCPELIIIG